MSIGIVCEWLDPTTRVNLFQQRSLQLSAYRRGRYSVGTFVDVYKHNARMLLSVMHGAVAAGVRSFRISSSLFPLFDVAPVHPLDVNDVVDDLVRLGALARRVGLRLTTHPGQFVVLSSLNDDVVRRSVDELEHHGRVFDAIGLPRSPHAAINVHGGKSNQHERLMRGIDRLSSAARDRLTLENDECSYTVLDLAQVSSQSGVPVCFDSHHHELNSGCLSVDDAFELAVATWPDGVRPIQHLSNSEPGCQPTVAARRKHSWWVHSVPVVQAEALRGGTVDVDFEFKGKNVAAFKAVEQFCVPLAVERTP